MNLLSAKLAIQKRLDDLEKIRTNYLSYQRDRVSEHDHHGAWDVAINLSETECEQAGIRFCLEALDQVDGSRTTDHPGQPGAPGWPFMGVTNGTG